MTAKPTPFSYNVGTGYHGFLTGNFYHHTLTISFCLRVSMVRIVKNWNLNILYNSHSLLFNSWIIKNYPKQITLSFSFDIIIWYPLFRVSDMNKNDWEYWVVNSNSNRVFFAPPHPPPPSRGWRRGSFLIETPVKKPVVNCSHIIGKGLSLAVIVKTILKLFYFELRCGVSSLHNPLSLNLTHPIPRQYSGEYLRLSRGIPGFGEILLVFGLRWMLDMLFFINLERLIWRVRFIHRILE